MRGKIVQVDWFPSDDEASLKRAYQQEQDALVKPRLHVLWLVRQGKQVQEAAEFVGVHRRTAGEWLVWYRQGGLAMVRSHRRGGYGRVSRLNAEQKSALIAKACDDGFVSVKDGVRFVREQFGIEYTSTRSPVWAKCFRYCSSAKKCPVPAMSKQPRKPRRAIKKGANSVLIAIA